MNIAQFAFPFSGETVSQSPPGETANDTAAQIQEILDAFDGETSLKRLFWELLSYDRVRDPLPLTLLPASALQYMRSLEVFADSTACSIVIAEVQYFPDGARLEQVIWAVKREIGHCIVLLTDSTTWQVVWPDETLKPRVRILPLPGAKYERAELARKLSALNAADEASGEDLTAFEFAENLDDAFPGPTPNIGDLLTDFDRIAQHPNPELRELLPFIRMAGQYPLLTAAQERGEDLNGDEIVPDGTDLPYQEWRLVVHNLRLVVWMANKVPRFGMSLTDLVQEGCTGLMIAAKRFDKSRGFRFTTYAYYWVFQTLRRGLHNQCNLIRWPVYRAIQILPLLHKGKEDGLTPGERPVLALKGSVQRRLWRLSYPAKNPIDLVIKSQACSSIIEALSELKPKERAALARRYGIDSGYSETLDSIGQDLGVTRERVRQLEEKALFKLGVAILPKDKELIERFCGLRAGFPDTPERIQRDLEISNQRFKKLVQKILDSLGILITKDERYVLDRWASNRKGYARLVSGVELEMEQTGKRFKQRVAEALLWLEINGQSSSSLKAHWNALEWRRTCKLEDGSVLAETPFRSFIHDLHNTGSES